jgi:hypothetical protein
MFGGELPKTIVEATKIYSLDLARIRVEAKKRPKSHSRRPRPRSKSSVRVVLT